MRSATTVIHDLETYGPESLAGPPLSLTEARNYCARLAHSHYENFTVASWLLPKSLRQHFYNIYSYCRWADDLADETADLRRSLELLAWWESQLDDCFRGETRHPVFIALRETIQEFAIPADPFRDLLIAFRQDQSQTRYESLDELLAYCRNSANPVGRLILHLGRCCDSETTPLSDSVCTGLQLANFCQDVARDCQRGRIYLPRQEWQRYGCDEAMIVRGEVNGPLRQLIASEARRAVGYLEAGWPLIKKMPRELRFDMALFIHGGLAILEAIARQNYDVWTRRPKLGKFAKMRLMAKAWMGKANDE